MNSCAETSNTPIIRMNRFRHILAALLAVVLLTGLVLNASALSGMNGTTSVSMADAGMLDGGCDDCGEAMDEAVCEAVCTGVVAVLPIDFTRSVASGSLLAAAAAQTWHGRSVRPRISPPDPILG